MDSRNIRMQDDYFSLMRNITRAAYPQPKAAVDPMEAPWDYLLEYEAEPITEPDDEEDYRSYHEITD